jgi:transposase
MSTLADVSRLVTGGVDTHAEVHVAGAVDQAGRVLGTAQFPAWRATPRRWRGCGATASW